MKRILSLALVCLLALSLFCGCGNEPAPATTAPEALKVQYPPLCQAAMEGLFGAEMEAAATGFGYKLEELERSPLGYLLPETVSYLGCTFSVYLIPQNADGKSVLVGIQYYMDLDPRNGGKALEYVGETLQRMHGYDQFRDFNARELANILNNKESWSENLSWVLTEDVSHLTPIDGRTAVTFSFRPVHDPAAGASYLVLVCDYGPVKETMIRK